MKNDHVIDSIQETDRSRIDLWYRMVSEEDKGNKLPVPWYSESLDISDWLTMDVPGYWPMENDKPVNGVMWFRRNFDVPVSLACQPTALILGTIVDADSVFINGTFVGTTGYQYPPRNYSVPSNVLKAGINKITVRLVSHKGFPEFVQGKPYKLVFPDMEINLEGQWKHKIGAIMPPLSDGGITFQYKPVGLYNAMIAPLKNHALKGIVWYQGESNTEQYEQYYNLMTALQSDWRNLWKQDLPFIGVQLANYMKPELLQQHSNWAELRDVQRRLYQSVPKTGMAVTIDLGEWNDIHPLNKKDVGKRLALQALSLAYNEKVVCDGPVFQSYTIDGNRIILSFKAGTDNFMPVKELIGFAIAGSDGLFKIANAIIEGNKIIVWHEDIAQPEKVRYAWADNPEGANLYNREGLPASPFQTE
jgi:sialate O-acetylesterase